MKKSIFFTLFFTVITLIGTNAQYEKKNVINLGLGGLAMGNISMNYERTFTESRAASLNAGVLIPRKLPSFIYDIIAEEIELHADNKISGFYVMPEFRFYPSYKIAPEGFYIAPFLKMNYYTLELSGVFDNIDADIAGKYMGFGGGIQFGMHWIIKERVSIDFYMAGPGLFYDNLTMRFESDDPGVDYDDLGGDVDVDISVVPVIGDKTEIEIGSNYVDANSKFIFPGFRTGISLGVVF